jgi:hypothetical protein
MRKIALLALIATLALTGCTQSAPKAAEPTKAATPALSVAWEKSLPIKASLIDNALFDNDVCQSEPSVNDGAYANDSLAEYNANTYRQCSNFHDFETDAAAMDCPANVYIYTGEGAGTDVKHALSYEDGWSLALLYGTGWQIEFEQANSMTSSESAEALAAKCAPTIATYSKLIGGGIVRYGDYNN